jgi:phosphoglucosamine mutase
MNVRVREKVPWERIAGFSELLAQAEQAVAPQGGRVYVRYSGTEPKARVLVEARDEEIVERWCTELAQTIQQQLGVPAAA